MTDPHTPLDAKEASALIESGVGRRGLLLAAAAMGVGSTTAATSTTTAAAHPRSKGTAEGLVDSKIA